MEKYDAVFIHYLTPYLANEVILNSSKNDIFLLMFWGAEVFMHPEFINDFYLPETKELLNSIVIKKKFKFAFKPKNFMLEFQKYYTDSHNARLIKKSLKRINYFCHWIPEDYKAIKNKFNLNAKYLNFFYSVMQSINSENSNYKINKKSKNILIGNSASESNNHIDIFEKLKNINFEGKKIYVPLSYAEYFQGYVNAVIKKGKEIFNDNFHPITDFLNSNEYYKIINSCDYIIMPHLRSQAGANVISGLFYGKKVFMSKKSNMYNFFKAKGFILFDFEKELISKKTFWNKLNENEIKHNKSLIEKHFGKIPTQNMYKNIIEELSKN